MNILQNSKWITQGHKTNRHKDVRYATKTFRLCHKDIKYATKTSSYATKTSIMLQRHQLCLKEINHATKTSICHKDGVPRYLCHKDCSI